MIPWANLTAFISRLLVCPCAKRIPISTRWLQGCPSCWPGHRRKNRSKVQTVSRADRSPCQAFSTEIPILSQYSRNNVGSHLKPCSWYLLTWKPCFSISTGPSQSPDYHNIVKFRDSWWSLSTISEENASVFHLIGPRLSCIDLLTRL